MSSVHNIPSQKDIEAEASAWVVQVDSGAMSKGDVDDLKEWIRRSPQHKHSFEKMAAGFLDMGSLLATPQTLVSRPKSKSKPIGQRRRRPIFTMPVTAGLLATALVASAFMAATFLGQPSVSTGVEVEAVQEYVASLGEQKSITLDDGSIVTLNTRSKVDVAYDDNVRRIELVYGEALFDVAKDPERPFQVFTERGMVRAIGTVFSVRVLDTNVEVLVEEGIVEVVASPQGVKQSELTVSAPDYKVLATLSSGDAASFDNENKVIRTVDLASVVKKHAWRDGTLIFDGDPLSVVVDEITRYTDLKIVISDPDMQRLQIGGTFKAGETDAFLDALDKGFNLSVDQVSEGVVYLSKK